MKKEEKTMKTMDYSMYTYIIAPRCEEIKPEIVKKELSLAEN